MIYNKISDETIFFGTIYKKFPNCKLNFLTKKTKVFFTYEYIYFYVCHVFKC